MSHLRVESSKLSIACLIHSLAGGGAERVMAGLVSRLALRGHEVALVTFDDCSGDRHSVDPGVRRIGLDLTSNARGLWSRINQVRHRQHAIGDAIRDLSPDVVLSFCDRTNIDLLMASSSGLPPIVVSERSDPARQSLGPIWNVARKRVYRRASSVVALTEASAEHLRSFCETVTVIPSAVEMPGVLSDRTSAVENKLVVAAGRLEPEKGFDRLIGGFANATQDDPEWKLVIYGEGSLRRKLAAQAEAVGIVERFDLPGWVRPLSDPMSKATLFCLSSRYEGFPSVLLEAMAMGVPSVSVDCESGPRVIIEHGRNGLLVEPSTQGITDGLARMMSGPALREKFGRAGMGVVTQFGWESMVDQYESLLQRCASQ